MSENGCDDSYTSRDRSPLRDDDDRRGGRNQGNRVKRVGGGGGGRAPAERRVYVSNISYESKWQDLKDLFVKEVGEVTYVNLFKDERGKARGCGIIEFADEETARSAVEKMHRYKISGRELVVKEDTDKDRDRYGYIIKDGGRGGGMALSSGRGGSGGGGGGGGGGLGMGIRDDRRNMGPMQDDSSSKFGNTYGLNVQFLMSLGIDGPLVSRVFVANLDYKVDDKKLKEVFKLAGKVASCEIHRDKEGNSRGYGTVEYDHPVEAVQAISMFKDQILFERKMAVRMDSAAMREEKEGVINRLPAGLKGIGMGLGSGGAPLKNVQGNVGVGGGGGNSGGGSNNNLSNAISGLVGAGGLAGATGLGNLGGLAGAAGLGALGAAGLGAGFAGATGLAGAVGLGAGLGGLGAAAGAGVGVGGLQGGGLMGSHPGGGNYGAGVAQSGRRNGADSRNDTIIVRNLPHHFTFNHLRERFNQVGEVLYSEIRDKGIGVVRFANEKDAQRAINIMDRERIDGHTINVYIY